MSGEAPLWMNLAGERAIMVDPDTDAPVIMDFHPWRLRASRGRREKKALRMFVMEMPVVQIHPAFVEQIDSWLPYVTRTLTLKGIKRYDGLLMDEERLVGLKVSVLAILCSIWDCNTILDVYFRWMRLRRGLQRL